MRRRTQSPSRNQKRTQMKTQNTVQQATVARGIHKVTHEVFYVVQSDTDPNTWYQIRWNNERMMWCCNCPAKCSGCKHNRAVQEVLKVRNAQIALAIKPVVKGTMAREVSKVEQAPS